MFTFITKDPRLLTCNAGEVKNVPYFTALLLRYTLFTHYEFLSIGVAKAAEKIPLKYFAREIIQDKRIVFSGKIDRKSMAHTARLPKNLKILLKFINSLHH